MRTSECCTRLTRALGFAAETEIRTMSDQLEELRRLALIGARQRWAEIEEERERLLELFPEIGRKPRGPIAKAAEPVVLFDASDVREPEAKPNGARPSVKPDEATALKVRAIELLKAGKTVPEVSAEIGREKSWIYRVAASAGVKPVSAPRGPGVKAAAAKAAKAAAAAAKTDKRKRHNWTDEEMKQPLAQLKAGAYMADVSRTFGINQTVLRRWADKHRIRVASMPLDERTERVTSAKRAVQREAGKHGHKGASARAFRPARDPEQRAVVLKRLANGETVSAIAKEMKIPKPTVFGWSKGKGGTAAAAENEEG
jgi:transposase-like protein